MGDRDRPAPVDLFLELGNDAARAAEHVAEADHFEARLAAVLQCLADHLAEALGRAHDVGRVPRLVRRDEHEFLHAVVDGGARNDIGAAHIVLHRLPRVRLLHEGNVLVGGRVEDERRRVLVDHLVHAPRVLDVAHDARHRNVRERLAQLLVDLVDRVFTHLVEDEHRRLESGDLAAKLGTDRSSRARHEDHLSRQQIVEARVVKRDRLALHQVFESDLADPRRMDLAADHVVQRRHRHDRDARALADFDHAPADLVRYRRHRDDRVTHLEALRDARQVLEPAEHARALQQPPALLLVVVEKPDDAPLVAARQLLHHPHGGVARAEDNDGSALLAAATIERPFLEGAKSHSAERHQRDEEDRVEDVAAIVELRVEPEHAQRDRDAHRPAKHREDDALDVGQARVAPDALVDPEEQVDDDLDRYRHREDHEEVAPLLGSHAVDFEKERRGDAGDRKRGTVVQCRSERAAVDVYCFHSCFPVQVETSRARSAPLVVVTPYPGMRAFMARRF